MGELVAFRPQSSAAGQARSHAARARNQGEDAEILFFTGVRFARFEDYVEPVKRLAKPARPCSPQKKRKPR